MYIVYELIYTIHAYDTLAQKINVHWVKVEAQRNASKHIEVQRGPQKTGADERATPTESHSLTARASGTETAATEFQPVRIALYGKQDPRKFKRDSKSTGEDAEYGLKEVRNAFAKRNRQKTSHIS